MPYFTENVNIVITKWAIEKTLHKKDESKVFDYCHLDVSSKL